MVHVMDASRIDEVTDYAQATVIEDARSVWECDYEILSEHLIDVYVNEILTMKMTCTAENLPELVMGRLFSEGIIVQASEVDSLYICEFGTRARVFLKERSADFNRSHVETVPSCCTGNRILNDYFNADDPLRPVAELPWSYRWAQGLSQVFDKDSYYHFKTSGTHSCRLFIGGDFVCSMEDIGRHNALDKVIGHCLLNDIDLKEACILFSGRIPTDVITKVIRSGIPFIATKAIPTTQSVALAREYGVTLIGKLKKGGMVIFSGAAQCVDLPEGACRLMVA